ncbi:DRG1 [Symbiodinium natans]|uniref:DRG1 protein n=1 Tax=Symbiodinium natans TaxID=878477 RepID=A0A812LKG1_9DINO|nr:DRG1 [Symbiodinium natans]
MALTTGGYNNMSSTLRRQARELSAEADSLQKLEMRKSAEKLQPQACEVCGMGYLDEEEYKAHLTFRVHEGYQQVRDKYEELEKKRAQRARKSKARAKSQPQPSTSQEPPKRDARLTVALGTSSHLQFFQQQKLPVEAASILEHGSHHSFASSSAISVSKAAHAANGEKSASLPRLGKCLRVCHVSEI